MLRSWQLYNTTCNLEVLQLREEIQNVCSDFNSTESHGTYCLEIWFIVMIFRLTKGWMEKNEQEKESITFWMLKQDCHRISPDYRVGSKTSMAKKSVSVSKIK